MVLSMYAASLPLFHKMLDNLDALLDKAVADAAIRSIDAEAFLKFRMAPDMFDFTRQVQLATNFATAAAARLAGVEVTVFPNTEDSFAALKARLKKAQDYLASFTPAQFESAEVRAVSFKIREREMNFTGQDYLLNFVLPNFYFHCTAVYVILRHNGVKLGKGDYVSGRDA